MAVNFVPGWWNWKSAARRQLHDVLLAAGMKIADALHLVGAFHERVAEVAANEAGPAGD